MADKGAFVAYTAATHVAQGFQYTHHPTFDYTHTHTHTLVDNV